MTGPTPETGAVRHRGHVYLPLSLAERATQTTIEVALDATRLSGIHLPPGERWGNGERWDSIPAVVRFTGAQSRDARLDPDVTTGEIVRCGWADCPGLAASAPIHEHEWGRAHELCQIAMDAPFAVLAREEIEWTVAWGSVYDFAVGMSDDDRALVERLQRAMDTAPPAPTPPVADGLLTDPSSEGA